MSVHFRPARPADMEALLPMLRVVSRDNHPALRLYQRYGFAATDRLLLSRPVSRLRVLCQSGHSDAPPESVVQ